MEKLEESIVLNNGTTFTHKKRVNKRWYYYGYCGVCNEKYKTDKSNFNTGHKKCISKIKINTKVKKKYKYIELRYIDGNLWCSIEGYDGYWVNKEGKVLGCKGRILKGSKDKRGYVKVDLCNNDGCKKESVHRIVAKAFIYNDNPSIKIQVNHKNGIKDDNRVENLEWCTNYENMIHKINNNLHNPAKGEKNNFSKLKNEQVIDIYTSTKPYKELEEKYKISYQAIRKIKKREYWKEITENYPLGEATTNRLSEEKIKKIYTTAGKYKDIALIFNVHEDTVSKIKNGKVHFDIIKNLKKGERKNNEK